VIVGDVDIEIMQLYSEDPTASYSINRIAQRLGKSYPYVNKRVGLLLEEGVLFKQVVGTTYLCSANLTNDLCIWLLGLVGLQQKLIILEKNSWAGEILATLESEGIADDFVCGVLHGSRLVLVSCDGGAMPDAVSSKRVEVMTRKEFKRAVVEEKLFRSPSIVLGFEGFYRVVRACERNILDSKRGRA
jgi:hypothetical protein